MLTHSDSQRETVREGGPLRGRARRGHRWEKTESFPQAQSFVFMLDGRRWFRPVAVNWFCFRTLILILDIKHQICFSHKSKSTICFCVLNSQ